MALVMLPCELPWWGTVQKHLHRLCSTKNTLELIEGMRKIHDLCNISLDPDDEENNDSELFIELSNFLDNDFTSEERSNFLNRTLQNIIQRALNLKKWKPRAGLHFSLQQQPDSTELEYNFISSLIANAFFSTFPKRTDKSHPTLQNFNFTGFFKSLNSNTQRAKLRSILHYFDWLDSNENVVGNVRITRQVMSSKEWLTIEDWLECTLPLCQLQIKHEGRLERSDEDSMQICFSSAKVGGRVLTDGKSQECISLVTLPEILPVLLHVEALEDNEVLMVERVRHISRITDPKNRACLEKIEKPLQTSVCCVDADDFTKLPVSQYEEDNVLRELNKCLLAFQQTQPKAELPSYGFRQRRLSPIGESIGSSTDPSEPNIPIITQQSCSTHKSGSSSPKDDSYRMDKLKVIEAEKGFEKKGQTEGTFNNRRGRFIVLGSSGECLPVKRIGSSCGSQYSSCSSTEEFHSAQTSLEGSGDEDYEKRYSIELETPEKRQTFAQRLREALRREKSNSTISTESSYAVGISVVGSKVEDPEIKLRRGGSTGFMLTEDSLDEDFLRDSLQQEQQWIDKFKSKQSVLTKKDSNRSSEYSFSTEFSSELEEVYEQFSKWLSDPILETDKGAKRVLDQRDLAVVQFAGSLLKRTLSESFAGVPLVDGCETTDEQKKSKIVLNARSLSLELARQKHRLAAQLLTQIAHKPKGGLKVVSTGNWGCGSSRRGEVQLKVIIQWLAASVAGIPALVYYTAGHKQLAALDTVCRILRDRKWTVKDLAQATLRHASQVLHGRNTCGTLFEELIGVERTV